MFNKWCLPFLPFYLHQPSSPPPTPQNPLMYHWNEALWMIHRLSSPGFLLGSHWGGKLGEWVGDKSTFPKKTHPNNTCTFFAVSTVLSLSRECSKKLFWGLQMFPSPSSHVRSLGEMWFLRTKLCVGCFIFGGGVGVGAGHGFAAFQEEGGLALLWWVMEEKRLMFANISKPSLCFLVLHPSPTYAEWTHQRWFEC